MTTYTLDRVKELIDCENDTIEFKKSTGQLERGMETICAFLNGKGGSLLFGVNDSGEIIGQDVADTTKRDIANALNRIEPQAEVIISYIAIPNSTKQLIVLHVEEARYERPFTYKGCPYHRIESVTTTMPQVVYNDLLIARDGHKFSWEKYASNNLSINDLDENEILKTVRLGINAGRMPENTGTDIPTILQKFNLLANGVLNNAAGVLFSKNDECKYTQCLLRLARFKGTDKTEFIDSQRLYGNIFFLFDAAMSFLFKHLSLSGKIEGFERDEQLTIPYKAIREGVINSLCHRCYKDPGGSVSIAIYDDRVIIENPGSLPPGWDLDTLLSEHESKPRNPIIANVLYKRKVLESWGRGVNLIIEECVKASLPHPNFIAKTDSMRLVFHYKAVNINTSTGQVPGQPTGQVKKQSHSELYNITRQPTGQVPGQPTGQPFEQINEIIHALGNSELSSRELMNKLRLKGRDNFLKMYLYPAIEYGFIEVRYPDQPNHPKQKYYLTEKGKALIRSTNF